MALGSQRLEGPDDVLGGDGLAVVEARLGPELKGDEGAVGGAMPGTFWQLQA